MATSPCLICCADEATCEFKCPLCPQSACIQCWMTSLLGDRSGLRCFDCRREWVVETLLSAPAFSAHRAVVLDHTAAIEFDKELSLLVVSQEEAALQRQIRRLTLERNELGSLKQVERRFRKSEAEACEAAKVAHREKTAALNQEQRALKDRSQLYGPATGRRTQQPAPTNVATYVQRCDDPCRGFVRASDSICSVCERKACRHCGHMLQSKISPADDHRCDPDEIATYEERRKNHKLCPNCHAEIFKAFGCDQMFCVSCHTAFSWSTLAIDRGNIHNPEYFRYLATLQEHGAPALLRVEDVACGELPEYREFITVVRGHIADTRYVLRFAESLYACIEHVRALPLLAHNAQGGQRAMMATQHSNLDIRVAYINGEFDDDAFRSKVVFRYRKSLKTRAFCELLNFILTILIGSARNIAFTPTMGVFRREVNTLAGFMALVRDEYEPDLLSIHGGNAPPSMREVFPMAFETAIKNITSRTMQNIS